MSVAPDRVCVVVARTRHKMIQVEVEEAAKRSQFLELRLDFLTKAVDFKRLLPHKKCAWMATLRRPADGGRWPGTEDARQMVLRQAIVSNAFEWIDLEMDIANTIRRFGPVKRVISYHNMQETPANLDEIYEKMLQLDGDVYKIAVLAQKSSDNAKVLDIQRRAPKPTIAFCMGEIGFPTRFMALKYGAPWIYASFNKERNVAPGMPGVEEFRTTYPVRSINENTKFYGVIGDPVAQSYSPILHNHMMKRMKHEAIYLPFRVPSGELFESINTFEAVPVEGYSVTIPHKEAALEYATSLDQSVELVGAANTLVRRGDKDFFAVNTDLSAAVESLKVHLSEKAGDLPAPQFNQLLIMILGAGGAARALAAGLHHLGAHVTITSRNDERSSKLATALECKWTTWQARHNVHCDVLINCTPVGMHPNVDESPIHASYLKPGLSVFDTVYNPENTLLIREARTRGCHVITGVDMFIRQAAQQLEWFTSRKPDLELMREIMRKAMSPLTRALDTEDEEADDEDDE